MSNDEQPILPVAPTPAVPTPEPVAPLVEIPEENISKLDGLPDEAKKDLHQYILAGWGTKRIKNALEPKWQGKTNNILPANISTYKRYIEMHKDEIERTHKLTASLVEGSQESLNKIKAVANATEQGQSIKQQLDALVVFCQERIDAIKEQQKTRNVVSAQLESVLVSLVKEQRMIMEKAVAFHGEIERDIAAELDNYIMAFMEEFIGTTIISYQELHGEFKLTEFATALKAKLPAIREAIRRERSGGPIENK